MKKRCRKGMQVGASDWVADGLRRLRDRYADTNSQYRN